METKKYPGWENAIEKINTRFEAEGYGIIFSETELLKWFSIKKPDMDTYENMTAFAFEKMTHIENTKNRLLVDFNLCLENIRGQGYQIVHPNDQVTKSANKYLVKARRKLNQMVDRLMHVDDKQLDMDAQRARINALGRAAFIKSAMNKRKIVTNGHKLIKDK